MNKQAAEFFTKLVNKLGEITHRSSTIRFSFDVKLYDGYIDVKLFFIGGSAEYRDVSCINFTEDEIDEGAFWEDFNLIVKNAFKIL